jgi:hypothetical protein
MSLTVTEPSSEILDDFLVQRLTDDVSRRIFTYQEIAARYSLTIEQLYAFLSRPEIRKLAKAKRALWESDQAATERLKAYWTLGMIEAAPDTLKMLKDPSIPASVRVELTKIGARIAGVDGGRDHAGNGAAPGGQFAVNIIFSDSREAITTVGTKQVIEADELTVPATPDT